MCLLVQYERGCQQLLLRQHMWQGGNWFRLSISLFVRVTTCRNVYQSYHIYHIYIWEIMWFEHHKCVLNSKLNLTIMGVHVVAIKLLSNIRVGVCGIGDRRAKMFLSYVLFKVKNWPIMLDRCKDTSCLIWSMVSSETEGDVTDSIVCEATFL
jgi:hypothetical protein